jgi:hypothetical protein
MSDKISVQDPNPIVSSSASLPECPNIPVTPHITNGNIHVKIPVVLAEIKIQFDMDSQIDFTPDHVLEIKDVKKRFKLTQSRLLLPTNKLFLKGFVRKNIQYAAPTSATSTTVNSNIRSLTVDIPFQCVTALNYLIPPVLPKHNNRQEFEFFTSTELPASVLHSSNDRLLAGDLSQFDQINEEFFNELPYCELISAKFTEFDEALNRTAYEGAPFEEGTFNLIEEKMVVELTLKVLQKQQLRIHSFQPVKDEEEEEEECFEYDAE